MSVGREDRGTYMLHMDALNELREWLTLQPAGPVKEEAAALRMLGACWDDLPGGNDEAMSSRKVCRAESLEWHPPVLSFLIERHGGTCMGSTRAEIQRWEVNVERGTADCQSNYSYRQLYSRERPFRAKAVVKELARKIVAGEDDLGLVWNEDRDQVCLEPRNVLPEGGFRATRSGRSKSFRKAVEELLPPPGWCQLQMDGRDVWEYRREHPAEPALGLLLDLLSRTPGLRLGQLIAEAVRSAEDLADIGDEAFADRLEQMLEASYGKNSDLNAMAELRSLLDSLPAWPTGDDAVQVLEVLEACWDDLPGGNEEDMSSQDLALAKHLRWNPPVLDFEISTRAKCQRWQVDLEAGIAAEYGSHHCPQAPACDGPFRAKAVVQELARKIVAGEDDPGLAWNKERDRVHLVEGRIAPGGDSKEAQARRLSNFRKAVKELLPPPGWCQLPMYGLDVWQYRREHPAEPALGLLLDLLSRTPGLRLGQLIAEVLRPDDDLADIGDAEFADRLERMLQG